MPDPLRPDDAQLPAHPGRVDDAGMPNGSRWAGIVIVALLGALVVFIAVLHVFGTLGPGAH